LRSRMPGAVILVIVLRRLHAPGMRQTWRDVEPREELAGALALLLRCSWDASRREDADP
jgi:hypothetical protein